MPILPPLQTPMIKIARFKSRYRSGVSNMRAACGPRRLVVRPAMLFGNFQIINIYVSKCLKKRYRKIIEPKLEDKLEDAVCVPALALQTKFSLFSKFLRNLGSRQKTSTHAFLRKHTTGFIVKSLGECCGNTVLTAPCYWPSSKVLTNATPKIPKTVPKNCYFT